MLQADFGPDSAGADSAADDIAVFPANTNDDDSNGDNTRLLAAAAASTSLSASSSSSRFASASSKRTAPRRWRGGTLETSVRTALALFSAVAISVSLIMLRAGPRERFWQTANVKSWTMAGVGSVIARPRVRSFVTSAASTWPVSFNIVADYLNGRQSRRVAALQHKRLQDLKRSMLLPQENDTTVRIGILGKVPVWFLSAHADSYGGQKWPAAAATALGNATSNWSPGSCNLGCTFVRDKEEMMKSPMSAFVQMLDGPDWPANLRRWRHPQYLQNGTLNRAWVDPPVPESSGSRAQGMLLRAPTTFPLSKPVVLVTWERITAQNYALPGVPATAMYADPKHVTGGFAVDADVFLPYAGGYDGFYCVDWESHKLAPPVPDGASLFPALAVVVSNCASWRIDYLRALSKHFPVHFLGRCGEKPTNVPPGIEFDTRGRLKDKASAVKAYKFVFAGENSITQDYVTEKIFHVLQTGPAVPVYIGAPNVADFVPSLDALVVATHLEPEELGALLRNVSGDAERWRSFHAWRDRPMPEHLQLLRRTACNFGFACAMCNCVKGYAGCDRLRE